MTNAKQITDRFWTLFEAGQLDELKNIIDPDISFKMPGAPVVRGRDALLQMLSAYRAAFPDLRHEAKSHVENGDTIAIELIATGTHKGPMVTPQGTVPPTGNKVVWESCDYIRVRDGRVMSWHVYHDTVPFLTAIGVLPAH
jgi:ketosteroid isomerase-like protein